MINEVIDGVRFQNLPAFVDSSGKISYPLNSWAVAELIATKIDNDVKANVTVDFSSVDVQRFLTELNDGQTARDTDDPQKKLLDFALNGEN